MLFLSLQNSEIHELWDLFHLCMHPAYLAWDIGDLGRGSQTVHTDFISKLSHNKRFV